MDSAFHVSAEDWVKSGMKTTLENTKVSFPAKALIKDANKMSV